MIRAFVTALLLIVSVPAVAQEWGPYGEQVPTYPEVDDITTYNAIIAQTLPVRGDGTTEWGGTPPAMALQPTAIENPVDYDDGLLALGGTTGTDENKFRIVCFGDRAVIRSMDPIKLKGQRRAGHLHYFWGAQTVNENSDYTQLRNDAAVILPSCPGNGLWGTSYWAPTVEHPNALGDGIRRVKKFKFNSIYYVCPSDTTAPRVCVHLPRGLGFIGGTDVDDPLETKRLAEIATANAASSDGDYVRPLGDVPVRPTWICFTESSGIIAEAHYLKDANGVDAMNNCPASPEGFLRLEIYMQTCWDGKNLTSPDGKSHVRYALDLVGSGLGAKICPTGWYRIPQIEHKLDFYHRGPSDYLQWECSSDITTRAAYPAIPFGSCETAHMDVIPAMDPRAQADWEANCTGSQDSTDWAGACGSGTVSISPDRMLDDTAIQPSGTIAWDGSDASGWFSIPNEGSNKRVRLRKGM